MHCRICFGEKTLLPLLCKCKDDLSFVHYHCAKKWYADHIVIVWQGKLKDREWLVSSTAQCEICKEKISTKITTRIYNDYKERNYK